MPVQHKPIIHGRDHAPGGADPIPGPGTGFTTYRQLILSGGPWAYWPMDDTTGDFAELVAGRDMAAVEAAGGPPGVFTYGLPGPFTDDPGTSTGFAGFDSGVVSNLGTSGTYGFSAGDTTEVYDGAGFTFELWFYPANPAINNQSGVKNYEGYLIDYSQGVVHDLSIWAAYLDATGTLHVDIGGAALEAEPVRPDNWNHLAVTFDGTTARLYLNGSLVDSGASTGAGGEADFQVGRQVYLPTYAQYFEGRFAHVAIYTAALDADTISSHATTSPPLGGATEHQVLESDGSGGTRWAEQTVKVDGTRYQEILTGSNLTSTDNSDETVTIDASGGSSFDPATATTWWFPLADSTGILVLDASGNLIPTLLPL